MANRADITPELCRQLLRLDRATGELFWKRRATTHFRSEREAKRWNTRYAEQPAFRATSERGYRRGHIYGITLPAHQVVFAIVHGRWADGVIDHINGDPADNRPENLRDVSQTLNCRNARKRSDNTSGVTGLYWCRRERKWMVRVALSGRNHYIGRFKDQSDAIRARNAAYAEYGFGPNHGSGAAQ